MLHGRHDRKIDARGSTRSTEHLPTNFLRRSGKAGATAQSSAATLSKNE
jgi:hypothetical protein